MKLTLNKPDVESQFSLVTILLMEDDLETAEVMEMICETSNYKCRVESVRNDILNLLEETKPSLVILDYKLSNTSGDVLCRTIKQDSKWNKMPVIIYSACIEIDKVLEWSHCDAYLSKPFDISVLLNLVNRIISKKFSH